MQSFQLAILGFVVAATFLVLVWACYHHWFSGSPVFNELEVFAAVVIGLGLTCIIVTVALAFQHKVSARLVKASLQCSFSILVATEALYVSTIVLPSRLRPVSGPICAIWAIFVTVSLLLPLAVAFPTAAQRAEFPCRLVVLANVILICAGLAFLLAWEILYLQRQNGPSPSTRTLGVIITMIVAELLSASFALGYTIKNKKADLNSLLAIHFVASLISFGFLPFPKVYKLVLISLRPCNLSKGSVPASASSLIDAIQPPGSAQNNVQIQALGVPVLNDLFEEVHLSYPQSMSDKRWRETLAKAWEENQTS
ncbi:hypothetical protein GQ44DRAFT_773498 [Phaeosphaeriaceae sp. PMI808]|nr:hypothetical protein GQ44DRAFT_773498 [Phaeosphaeriaceae sp. PMI808]